MALRKLAFGATLLGLEACAPLQQTLLTELPVQGNMEICHVSPRSKDGQEIISLSERKEMEQRTWMTHKVELPKATKDQIYSALSKCLKDINPPLNVSLSPEQCSVDALIAQQRAAYSCWIEANQSYYQKTNDNFAPLKDVFGRVEH